jgi:hypothetical protein
LQLSLPLRALAAGLAAVALSACALGTTVHADGSATRHYLGYVAVTMPRPGGKVYSSETSVVGLRIDNGVGVGYVRDRMVVVPLDCRTVLLVANQRQYDGAVRHLHELGAQGSACAALDPSQAGLEDVR